jgi:hypothetical protein
MEQCDLVLFYKDKEAIKNPWEKAKIIGTTNGGGTRDD